MALPVRRHQPAPLLRVETELARHSEQLQSLDRLTEAKFVTFRTLIDSQAEKVALALAASDKAIQKSEMATEKRFESVNEFRGTLSDQTRTFISRVEFEALRSSYVDRLAELQQRLERVEGHSAGLSAGWVYLLGGIAAVGTIISMVVMLSGK